MNLNIEPDDASNAKPEWPSVAEFEQWLKADPKNLEHWSNIVERSVRGDYGELPLEMRALAEKAVAKRKEAACIKVVQAKLLALLEVLQRPAGSMLAEARLAQAKGLMEELTDALLETPEPHRSGFLKQLLPIRELVRALKVPE